MIGFDPDEVAMIRTAKLCRALGKTPREIRDEPAADMRLVLGVIAGEIGRDNWLNRRKGLR